MRLVDGSFPKFNTIEAEKSHIKNSMKEIHKIDLTASMIFPDHTKWWNNYKYKLKSEGKMIVNHYKPLPSEFLDKYQSLTSLLVDIAEARGTAEYVLVSKLPNSSYHSTWNRLLGHCIQFLVQLFFCLRGCEVLDQIQVKMIEKVESEDLEYSYYRLVMRPPDKNHKTDVELEGAGGTLPFLEVSPGFNPGLLLERYIGLIPSSTYLLLHATSGKNGAFLRIQRPNCFMLTEKLEKTT